MTPNRALAIAALILAILSLFRGFPFLAAQAFLHRHRDNGERSRMPLAHDLV